jgi:hypothetical protein
MRLAILLLCACAARPVVVEPAPSVTPWCFRATAMFDGKPQAALGCFATASLCGNAQRRAAKLGGLAGLREVGTCHVAR